MKHTIILLIGIMFLLSCSNEKAKNGNENMTNAKKSIASVPQWAKHAIWYQIFVERFRNGDTSNDPRRQDIQGADPDFVPKTWKISRWGQDWYTEDDYFKDAKAKNKWDNLQLRRYGGDLQGVIDKLDYLSDLGINAIYFNPLNDAPSMHKYDPRSWRHIDVNFGTNPDKDIEIIKSEDPINADTWRWTTADSLFLKLIKLCHAKGIKVVMDYSFNHTGRNFWAFQDVREKGKKSKFAEWYNIESFDNPETAENEFSYRGWSGVQILPELKKDIVGNDTEFPFEGNLHSPSLKQHIFNVAARWLDPNKDGNLSDGVDGYRLDVAAEIPKGFWVEFRKFVRKINPDAYLVGEIWWKKYPDELLAPHEFLQGDMFDAIMNYRWYKPARHFFAGAPDVIAPSKFVAELNDKLSGISRERSKAMMNVVASHDVPRVSTSLYNKVKYKYGTSPYRNSTYKIEKPDEATIAIQKMLLIHQFTYIGAPHIWYGDEVGMWGAEDPDTRKPMIWQDIEYEDEAKHPLNLPKRVDKVEQDTDLLNFYKKLIAIRKSNPVLIDGDLKFSLVDDKNSTLAYTRSDDKSQIVVAFNNSDDTKTLEIPVAGGSEFIDLLDNKTYIAKQKALKIELEEHTAIILKGKRQ